MMNNAILLLLFVGGISAGWALAGFKVSPAAPEADTALTSRSVSGRGDATHAVAKAPPAGETAGSTAVDLAELEGIHSLGGGSPALNLSDLLVGGGGPGTVFLARWLRLSKDQELQLTEILTAVTAKQIEWERKNIPRTESDATHVRLEWRPMPPEIRSGLRARLREAFGDEVAEKIWLKGNLDNFALPRDQIGSSHTTVELTLTGNPASGSLKLGIIDVESGDSDFFLVPPDLSAAASIERVPLRFSHFFDWDRAVAKLRRESPAAPTAVAQSGYPMAEPVQGKRGFVFSPYNNTVIDVRDLPPGMLVADPTFPAEEKKFLRVPPEVPAD